MKKILFTLVLLLTVFGISQAATSYTSDLSTTSVTIYTGESYIKSIYVANSSTSSATIDISSNSVIVFTVYVAASSKEIVPETDIERIYCSESIKIADRDTYAAQRVTGQVDVYIAYDKIRY